MYPKFGRRGGSCCSQPAQPPFIGCGPPHPPFGGVGRPFARPPFMGTGPHRPPFWAHFPFGRGGRRGFPLRGGFQGAGRCRPPFVRGEVGPCFLPRGCQRPFHHPFMDDRVFQGAWWETPHRWHFESRRPRHSFGRSALAAASFEMGRALMTLSQEDSESSEVEEEETPCRGRPEDEAEIRATAKGKSSSGTHQEEGWDGQWEPTEEVIGCCRSDDVWKDCGQGSWRTEVEAWPYAENEVEACVLEDGRVEVRCEHFHGETLIASNTHVLPCPPCGPATLTTAYGPPNAQPGMLVLLVTANGPEEKDKASAPAGEGAVPVGGEELPAQEDVEIVDISDAMEKC